MGAGTVFLRRLVLLLVVAVVSFCAVAQKGNDDFDPFSASIEDNLKTPVVSSRHSAAVVSAMTQLERSLKSAGYKVTLVRSGEVVMVTIPCSSLFAPNSKELKPEASAVLKPLAQHVDKAESYKTIVAVHADNTGDEEYADAITADRATAIDDFFYNLNGRRDTGIIPYGIGADEPVAPNTGIRNRAANRRVEIYFVPTADFIAKAQKK